MEIIVQRVSNYFRIVVLGGGQVGKTTWIENALKEIGGTSPNNVNAPELWITEKMGPLWSSTIEFAEESWVWVLQGERFVFIFDLHDRRTLTDNIDNLLRSLQLCDIDKLGGILLVGNKADLVGDHDSIEETRRVARRLAEEGGFMYVETSSATGEGMAEALYLLLNKECRRPMDEVGKTLDDAGATSSNDLLSGHNHHTPLPL